MPLQNRVDPFGSIHAVPQRALFTGNRGIIHDPAARTLLKRRWTTKAWITCTLELDGRRRDVMGRNGRNGGAGWTELFFLDEVTALAAGHRPCFYCRRERAGEFIACFRGGNAGAYPSVREVDGLLHAERLASGGRPQPIDAAAVADLPDGAVIGIDGAPHAVRAGRVLPWSFSGYEPPCDPPGAAAQEVVLLTPPATVAALRAGYDPVWHPSAGA